MEAVQVLVVESGLHEANPGTEFWGTQVVV
jgi:hypothetical protein